MIIHTYMSINTKTFMHMIAEHTHTHGYTFVTNSHTSVYTDVYDTPSHARQLTKTKISGNTPHLTLGCTGRWVQPLGRGQ